MKKPLTRSGWEAVFWRMRFSQITFWGTLLAIVGIFVGAVLTTFPSQPLFGYTVMWISGLALILLVFNQIWPKPIAAAVGHFRFRRIETRPVYMPLSEATRLFLEAAPQSVAVKTARREKTPDEVLDWLAYWLVNKGVIVYGKRPPSTVYEFIPEDRFRSGGVEKGASLIAGYGVTEWVDLAVDGPAFRKKLLELVAVS